MIAVCAQESNDKDIPFQADACYEERARQEEIYLEETEEELRMVLESDDLPSQQNESLDEEREHAAEELYASTVGRHESAAGLRRAGLREAGTLLTDRDAGLLTHAVALANWHAVAGFCSRCGAPAKPEMAGHSRRCTVDGSEHFPRCDPAVIMLVTDPDDRCLLARNAQWPQRRVSVLAGFVEPGEAAEQAVAREVRE